VEFSSFSKKTSSNHRCCTGAVPSGQEEIPGRWCAFLASSSRSDKDAWALEISSVSLNKASTDSQGINDVGCKMDVSW
jgi:hypothetical protein